MTTAYGIQLPPAHHLDVDLLSVGAAVQNLLLAAHTLGLGAYWMLEPVVYAQQEIKTLVAAPAGYHAVSLIAVGKSTKEHHGPRRKNLDEILRIRA